jgi:hypothetical protein
MPVEAILMIAQAAEGIQRAASAAQNGGAAMTFGAGASIPVTQYLGLSLVEWQIAGIVSGIFIGLIGLGVNTVFQFLRYRRGE